MKLFGRKQQSKVVIPPELQPYYGSNPGSARGSRIKQYGKLVLIILAILVVAGLATWFAKYRLHRSTPIGSKVPSIQDIQKNPVIDPSVKKAAPAQTPASSGGATHTSPIVDVP